MIVYSASAAEFLRHVLENTIADRIRNLMLQRAGFSGSTGEFAAWQHSLQCMANVLQLAKTPDQARVAIEYTVPLTAKRVDFILTGLGDDDQGTAVIVELKQWSELDTTDKDAVVRTRLGGRLCEVSHPSYQAWTYAALIQDFNETVRDLQVRLVPCAYLHNLRDGSQVQDPRYAEHLARAPVFLAQDALQLADFLRQHVRKVDRDGLLYQIEHGRIRPSRQLADGVAAMLAGKSEFHLVDEQKVAFETALALQKQSTEQKQVLLIEGGPGTGKSVLALNLLSTFLQRGLLAQYVSKNAAPRAVFEAKLTGRMSASRYRSLFRGSGSFVETAADSIDVLVIDEAHRLTEKSGLFNNQGINQVLEVIQAAKLSVFLLDEDQRVTLKDIGSVRQIEQWAARLGAMVTRLELPSQFRCNGSNGYLAWLDHILQVKSTANMTLDSDDYAFDVCDSATELHDRIRALNGLRNRSRVVAGYCWDWISKTAPERFDIVLDGGAYAARWNLDRQGSLWIIDPDSIGEVGCIHTCQGLELDHVGVIIGPDLIVRDGAVLTSPEHRSRMDASIKGYKSWARREPDAARQAADLIIRNTYRTLMTRGQKGCLIYSEDQETREWFRRHLARTTVWASPVQQPWPMAADALNQNNLS